MKFDMNLYNSRRKAGEKPDVEEEKNLVALYQDRCRSDFEFFCAKEIQIRTKKGELKPFIWNKPQRRLSKAILTNWYSGQPVRIIVLKARQWGCTTLTAAFITWVITQNKGKTAMVLSDDDDSTSSILEMYEIMRDNLSSYVKPVVDRSNRKLGYATTDKSAVRIKTAGTKQTAYKTGRSKTNQLLHFSEVAFWDSPKETMRAARQTCPMGAGTFVIDESTPNGEGNQFHTNWKRAKSGKSPFLPFFVPWYEIEEYTLETTPEDEKLWKLYQSSHKESDRIALRIHQDALAHAEAHNITLGQLKWWYWKLNDSCEGDEETMNQEYPWDDISCFLATGRPAFKPSDVNRLRGSIHAPERFDIFKSSTGIQWVRQPNGAWRVWEKPDENEKYVVTADICSGYLPGKQTNMDKSAIGVFKRLKGGGVQQVAAFYGRPEPDEVGEMMVSIGEAYNWGWLAPEVNSYGVGTLRAIRSATYPFIYRRQELNRATGSWQRNQIGWYTSTTTRPDMISTAKRLLRLGLVVTPDEVVINELQSMIHNEKTNKIEAPGGEHDDAAFMFMIACQVCTELPEIEESSQQATPYRVMATGEEGIRKWDQHLRKKQINGIDRHLEEMGLFERDGVIL